MRFYDPVDANFNFGKSGVPSPVTGSHPTTAEKPDPFTWLHPELFPPMISVNAPKPLLYNQGFKNPNTGSLCAIRSLLSSATIAAKAGAEALVPETSSSLPCKKVWKETPCAETSGYARPVVL